jgi:HK97 family phage portal protein
MARILNIPVYKLKDYSHATYSNVEQLQIEYRTDTIRPWAERWESAINTQLLTPQQQEKAFAEFDLNAISRGDMATEYKAYHDGRYGGYLNANEIRTKLGYNPIVGDVGEVYWMPTNMTDAAKQNNQQTNNEQSEVDNATSETTEG